jgi:beta-lactamase superfamily II metal-dependent hydrolase
MGDAGTLDPGRLSAAAPLNLADGDLAIFVLNVGDGDALVIRFPALTSSSGPGLPATTLVSAAVVDSASGAKTSALLASLGIDHLRFICATHPHSDHIDGLKQVLRGFGGPVDEYWDSGFRYTSATYHKLIAEVEARQIAFIRPTSGFELIHANALLTVLSPSIALRNRYDTYGVDVNNASIVLRLVYPTHAPSADYPVSGQAPATSQKSRTMILGGDAQTDAWGRVLDEFPHLVADSTNPTRQIGARTGAQPLACDFFKVSHHCSKRGINLELIERMGDSRSGTGPSDGPRWLAVSSASGPDSSYGFPHAVSQELMREVRDPQAQAGGQHPGDAQLGIHYTAQRMAAPETGPAGSIAYVVGADASARLYRFGDSTSEPVDLNKARAAR